MTPHLKPGLKTSRRIIQTIVALAFVLIPWLNHHQISWIHGNFLSLKLYKLPLADPLAVLQIILKNNYWALDLMIGAGIALGLAALLGTVFCSWVCPFGLISELFQGLNTRKALPKKPRPPGFKIKLVLFTTGILGFLIFSTTPVLNQLSLPAWYSRIFQFWFEQGHISLALAILPALALAEGLLGRRLWCRYLCPQSVVISLAKQITPQRLRVEFTPKSCTCRGHSPCASACTLDLDPRRFKGRWETECTNCGDCINQCKEHGAALNFKFGSDTPAP